MVQSDPGGQHQGWVRRSFRSVFIKFVSVATSALGSFSSDRPAPDALGMSASLRSRPNLRTAANRRVCELRTHALQQSTCSIRDLIGKREQRDWRFSSCPPWGPEQNLLLHSPPQ